MKEVFDGMEDVLNQLKWQELGFANKTRHDSAMWIGTAGAHTLCHYDTYGYNIVIQVKKRGNAFSYDFGPFSPLSVSPIIMP